MCALVHIWAWANGDAPALTKVDIPVLFWSTGVFCDAPALTSSDIKVVVSVAFPLVASAATCVDVPVVPRLARKWQAVAKATLRRHVPELTSRAVLSFANKLASSCVPFHSLRNLRLR